MRSIFRSTLLALLAVVALSAVASASASAAPEWLLNGSPVTKSTPITFTLSFFEASDTKAQGGAVAITCSAAGGKGTVAPSGGGSITEFKLSKCWRTKSGLCKTQTKAEQESTEWMRMINLSWPTKLVDKGLEAVDWVESHEGEGKGPDMGFEWECTNILGGKTKDKCETGNIYPDPYGTYITSLSDVIEGVSQKFNGLLGPTPPLTCSLGGEVAGEFYATIVLKGPEGQKLTYKV